MSDWQVGDLAVCVEAGDETREGQVYTVSAIQLPGEFSHGSCNFFSIPLLRFLEFSYETHSTEWSGAERFRKIRPDAHERCEDEFITLLKRTERKVAA